MDVQALSSAVIVAPPADPAQFQTQTNPPSPGSSGSTVAAASDLSSAGASPSTSVGQTTSQDALKKIGSPQTSTSNVHPAPAPQTSSVHVAYRYVQNPVQVVVVFTNAANGQEVAQVPPEFMVKLVQFDHDKGELIDRDA